MGRIRTRMKKSLSQVVSQFPKMSVSFVYTVFFTVLVCNTKFSAGLEVESLSISEDTCPITVTCEAKFSTIHETSGISVTWLLNDKAVEKEGLKSIEDYHGAATYYLTLPCDVSNFGNLTCLVKIEGDQNVSLEARQSMELTFPVSPQITAMKGDTVNDSDNATLHCSAKGYPPPDIIWSFKGEIIIPELNQVIVTYSNRTISASSKIEIIDAHRSDNGTYVCHTSSTVGKDSKSVDLFVKTKPEVFTDFALGVGNGSIFLNWTLDDGNLPVKKYEIKYMKEGTDSWFFSRVPPDVLTTRHVIDGLEPDVAYQIQIEAENSLGSSNRAPYPNLVKTLSSEAVYIPVAGIKGSTSNSFTLGWTEPPKEIRHLIGHYVVTYSELGRKDQFSVNVTSSTGSPVHLFTNLKPATLYFFRVKACQRYTGRCGDFSPPVNATTIDGKPSEPRNVVMICGRDSNTNNFYAIVSWEPPFQPNGQLAHYGVSLKGVSQFYNDQNQKELDKFGPMVQNVDRSRLIARFEDIPANTNYTVDVRAETRTQHGIPASASCQMPASMPNKENLNGISVLRYHDKDVWGLRLSLPKILHRKGPVCCFSVVVVKMLEGVSVTTLPEPENLPVLTYDEAHRQGAGAYIAELFDPDVLPESVFLGDNSRINTASLPCKSCQGIFWRPDDTIVRRSSLEDSSQMINVGTLSYDGLLSPESNYTIFLRVFAPGPDGQVKSVYSSYAVPMTPKPSLVFAPHGDPGQSVVLVVALGVLCGLALVLLVIVSVLLLLRRYSKHVAQAEGIEMSLSSSCRHLWSRFRDGGHMLVTVPPTAAAPIAKHEMLQAYVECHQNHDYGFQQEYETLPERFSDRTTRASDTRENMPKNRYPDIKAYDQTRVKLNVLNGDPNSDYINANFVMGYKERKRFVCAQGPMEGTVYDFWRMAWEQRVEIIVMLTNLEEYNKTKCFQYWPDPDQLRDTPTPEPLYVDPVSEVQSNGTANHSPTNGSNGSNGSNGTNGTNGRLDATLPAVPIKSQREKTFGDIRVLHVKEKRYSEYVVRELQVSRPKVNTPSDPEMGVMEREVRPVFQYHYLVWKDFQAPEHATGILRFLRRLNEDYSADRGPILIHCSAGVGRTGTLVAIDHLIQQVEEEGSISILNTVCDLRHQRNFLVQSLRQYIFVYRALMEWIQFGNTEISTANFQDSLKQLRTKAEGRSKSSLEEEFDRLSLQVDDRKPMAVALSEENQSRNRYETAIPLDRNRVILTPVPGRDYSTYINASFIEGYDNTECYIVTQDPLESTVRDFWRMVLEHNIVIIVMLSEMGSEASYCPQYWPDDDQEVTHDHLIVKHVGTVTLPAYIQRDFIVRSTRNREEIRTTQIQYLEWEHSPDGLDDETVPTSQQVASFVTIATETLAARSRQLQAASACFHCNTGNIRTSVLATLCILIEQARTEGYVDVFSTVRKLRSQRGNMIQHSSQYVFLYDALAYYLRTHPASLPPTP